MSGRKRGRGRTVSKIHPLSRKDYDPPRVVITHVPCPLVKNIVLTSALACSDVSLHARYSRAVSLLLLLRLCVCTAIYLYVIACASDLMPVYPSTSSILTRFQPQLRRNMLNAVDKNLRRGGRKVRAAFKEFLSFFR